MYLYNFFEETGHVFLNLNLIMAEGGPSTSKGLAIEEQMEAEKPLKPIANQWVNYLLQIEADLFKKDMEAMVCHFKYIYSSHASRI